MVSRVQSFAWWAERQACSIHQVEVHFKVLVAGQVVGEEHTEVEPLIGRAGQVTAIVARSRIYDLVFRFQETYTYPGLGIFNQVAEEPYLATVGITLGIVVGKIADTYIIIFVRYEVP